MDFLAYGLGLIMRLSGDLVALITLTVCLLTLGGVVFSAVGRISLGELFRFYGLGIVLLIGLGAGMWGKRTAPDFVELPNGLLFQFSDGVVLWLFVTSLVGWVGATAVGLYIWNK